jgi:hypothetical protein
MFYIVIECLEHYYSWMVHMLPIEWINQNRKDEYHHHIGFRFTRSLKVKRTRRLMPFLGNRNRHCFFFPNWLTILYYNNIYIYKNKAIAYQSWWFIMNKRETVSISHENVWLRHFCENSDSDTWYIL